MSNRIHNPISRAVNLKQPRLRQERTAAFMTRRTAEARSSESSVTGKWSTTITTWSPTSMNMAGAGPSTLRRGNGVSHLKIPWSATNCSWQRRSASNRA